jgi:putative DNA primase/helicase
MKFDGRRQQFVTVDAPLDYLRTWVEQGTWDGLRTVEAIMRAPFVRYDGSICDTPGYDEASFTLYAPSEEFPPIPEAPTRDDAFEALQRLREVVSEFPWKDGTSETTFLAHVFSEVTRMACERCPMFWYTAPRAGEGKTLLSELPSLIVHGAEPSLHPWVGGEELRKMLTAALHSGERSILLDNAQTGSKIRTVDLCAFLTSVNWSDRKLGETESLTIPNRAVLAATGNNVTPTGDLARRSFVIRLDANMQRTRDRVFKIEDLKKYVLANRATLLVDVLTILKAYYTTGRLEKKLVALPSFEEWTRRALEPLLWLGMPNPMETQEEETDDGTEGFEFAFQTIGAHFGGRSFTGAEVAKLAGSLGDSDGQLVSTLLESGCQDPSSTEKVGYWLRDARDQIHGGYKLVSLKRTKRGREWQLKEVTHG